MSVLPGEVATARQEVAENKQSTTLIGGLTFDLFFVVLATIFVGGLFLDG